MNKRTNAGFDIISAVRVNENEEIVIGCRDTVLGGQYVCWFCRGDDYYWGRYTSTYTDALEIMIERLKTCFTELNNEKSSDS